MSGRRRLPVNLCRQETTRGILLQLRSGLSALFSLQLPDKWRWRKVHKRQRPMDWFPANGAHNM